MPVCTCYFCYKDETEVRKLVSAPSDPTHGICDECEELVHDIMFDEPPDVIIDEP